MFLTAMYLCNALSCQEYIVDSASSIDDCYVNMEAHSNTTAKVWKDDKSLKWWLDVNDIHLNKTELESIVDYDYKCKEK